MKQKMISLCFAIAAGLLVLPTECFAGTENGHEYVDLGLSVKWATCNVGATAPEKNGDYYAWGEIQPKDDSGTPYKYYNGTDRSLTKYCTNSSCGTVDNKTTLEAMDDAATYNWGGTWRMPTDAEWTELREQCAWTKTIRNGKIGYEVKSKTNGNSIFLPAAGCFYDTCPSEVGILGYYWSSSLYESHPYFTQDVFFGLYSIDRDFHSRSFGQSVRPVCP